MRILVTGGHGFIGSHVLCQLADRGHEVGCLDITETSTVAEQVDDVVRFFRQDVTDPIGVYDTIARFDPQRIIHLASLLGRESQTDPRTALDINVGGTVNVLEAACSLGVERVVAASSAATFKSDPEGIGRLDEMAPQDPESIYGVTKLVVERIGRAYSDQRGVGFAALEPLHGVGPDRRRGNVEAASVIKAAVSGASLTVPRVEHPIEMIYVGDEARAFVDVAIADELDHDRFVVGTGEQVTLVELVDIVTRHLSEVKLEIGDRRGDDVLPWLPPSDTSRLHEETGWEPTKTVEEAVVDYIEWLQANPDAWEFDPTDVPWPTS